MKSKSVLEISCVLVLRVIFGWWLLTTGFIAFQIDLFYYPYSAGLMHFGIPLLIIFITGRNLKDYTFTFKNPEYNLEVSINAYLVGIIPWGIGLSLMWIFGMSLFDLPTVLGLSAGYVVATFVLFSFLRKWEKTGKLTEENAPSLRKNLLVVFVLLLVPIFLGGYYGQLTAQLVSLIVWQLVISGFGEEAFWRGYVQTRLNEGFGKPFEFMGVSFGWGLILTSFLFGLFHVLNPFNPFVGSFEINILWGVFTFFAGIFLGLIREKTGSLIATGVAHGLLDAVGEGIGLVLGL